MLGYTKNSNTISTCSVCKVHYINAMILNFVIWGENMLFYEYMQDKFFYLAMFFIDYNSYFFQFDCL